MTPGERFKAWIDGLGASFGDRLKGWMASWVEWGLTRLMESLEPEAIDIISPVLTPIVEHPATPQYIKDIIDKLLAGKKPLPLLLIIPIAVLLFIPTITSIFQPLGNIIRYTQERLFKSFRLDPFSVITAWRRDPKLYEGLFDDLKDQGWSPERIEALKYFTLFMPAAPDIVNWYAKEVYEPDMIERYGLDSELPVYEQTDFPKIGVDATQARNYWRAHWEHASFIQVVEMLRRGLLTLDKDMPEPPKTPGEWANRDSEGAKALYDWYRLVEIPPFWRSRLTEMVWEVPTRVDVRRWWDMRTIDENELYNIYHRQGYHGKDLENYVRWTKVYTDFPVKMAHFTNGWINEDDIRAWLRGLEIPEDRIEDFIREKTKPAKAERVAGDKNLTMALIVEGVKKGVISESEGVELLMEIGYDADEADYIIRVRLETVTGSPENMEQFRDITQKYRKAVGIPSKPVDEALQKAASEKVRLTKEVEDLTRLQKEERAKLADDEILPKEATARYDEVTLALHRAEAELYRVTTDYNALLAEWKQTEAK